MERTRYFVDHGDNEWLVIQEGAGRPLARCKTKRQAIERGRATARRRGHSQLVIKGKNHVIQKEWTYGQDPKRYLS